jgi:radical SAM superfamily enzyme YgiQ (UPF0313 family)
MKNKRILFGASYSSIEPLGILHLSGLARDCGWDRKIHLVKNHNFEDFFESVKDYKPDIVGFNVYTGNHTQLAEAFYRLKKDFKNIMTIVGGPHPTYFPAESSEYSDYVVMSEGFGALKKILAGNTSPGIMPMGATQHFPLPDRETFYQDYPEHANSKIKSIITMTGCPYTCTYCYNSSTIKELADNLPPALAAALGKSMKSSGRLFPKNVRCMNQVIEEGKQIAERWPTSVIYFQDDIFGFDAKEGGMLEQLAERWPKEVGIPFHSQMRWEMTVGKGGEKRLDLVKEAGGFGITLAIEAADPIIRKEILDRGMPEEMIFEGMKNVVDRGFKIRTEQITGLPYGATSEPTKMNLDADLELLELNVRLKEETGGPTMAWASTLAPYKGTKMGTYCAQYGHYESDNNDVPDTFFESSVLRFPKEWHGPDLENKKNDPEVWLDGADLVRYRKQNAELRKLFNFFAAVPEGHILAEKYLKNIEDYSYDTLGEMTIHHLNSLENSNNNAKIALQKIESLETYIENTSVKHPKKDLKDLKSLASYFACLPKSKMAVDKTIDYSNKKNELSIDPGTLSTAVRHHLYDNVLYYKDEQSDEG